MVTEILVIISFFSVFITLILWTLQKPVACLIAFGITMGLFLSMWVSFACTTNKPTAIEVYQGKTTLEYKIVDGEVIDSCVRYKHVNRKAIEE